MAIKLNGVDITSNKLNGSNVSKEKLNGTVVYSFSPTTTAQWQFVGSYSSEPDNYDLFSSSYINGDYEQGILHLNNNYPAGNYHEGFVAVIADLSTLDFFEYVVVAV